MNDVPIEDIFEAAYGADAEANAVPLYISATTAGYLSNGSTLPYCPPEPLAHGSTANAIASRDSLGELWATKIHNAV